MPHVNSVHTIVLQFCSPDSLRKGSVVYGLAVLTKLTRGHSHTNEEHCDNTIE